MQSLKKRRVYDYSSEAEDDSIPRIIITVPVRLIPEIAHLGVATLPRSLFAPHHTPTTILLDVVERRGDKYLWEWISKYLNIEDLWALNQTDRQRAINFRFVLHGGCSSHVLPEVQALYLVKLGEVWFILCFRAHCISSFSALCHYFVLFLWSQFTFSFSRSLTIPLTYSWGGKNKNLWTCNVLDAV